MQKNEWRSGWRRTHRQTRSRLSGIRFCPACSLLHSELEISGKEFSDVRVIFLSLSAREIQDFEISPTRVSCQSSAERTRLAALYKRASLPYTQPIRDAHETNLCGSGPKLRDIVRASFQGPIARELQDDF